MNELLIPYPLQWRARWLPVSPASRLFVQLFIQAQIKENIKVAPSLWPVCGEFTGDQWNPAQRASDAENVSICMELLLYPDWIAAELFLQLGGGGGWWWWWGGGGGWWWWWGGGGWWGWWGGGGGGGEVGGNGQTSILICQSRYDHYTLLKHQFFVSGYFPTSVISIGFRQLTHLGCLFIRVTT